MAAIQPSNPDGVSRFKQRINFQQVTAAIQDDKKVLMDWQQALKQVKMPDNRVWESDEPTLYIKNNDLATASGFFIRKSENVKYQIYVFTDENNKSVAEQVVNLAGITSMMDIAYDYLPHDVADFYIHSAYLGDSGNKASVICSYKNVILSFSGSKESVDVGPFVDYFLKLMSASLIDKNQLMPIAGSVSSSPSKIKQGDDFVLDVSIQASGESADYEIDYKIDEMPDGIDFIRDDNSKHYFTADKAGTYQFDFGILNVNNLLTGSTSVTVIVEN